MGLPYRGGQTEASEAGWRAILEPEVTMLAGLLWISLAFADPDPLAPLVAELAALPDHAAREARIEAILPTWDAANQARLRDAEAAVHALAAAGVVDRGQVRSYLYAALSTDPEARKKAIGAASRGAQAPVVDNWPEYHGSAGPTPAAASTPPGPAAATLPRPAAAPVAPKPASDPVDTVPETIAALPTNAARITKLQGMLGDAALDADQLARTSAALVVLRTLDQQKRSDPTVIRWFLRDAVQRDPARRQAAIDAAKVGGDPPSLAAPVPNGPPPPLPSTPAVPPVIAAPVAAAPSPVTSPPAAAPAPDMAKLRQYRSQYLHRGSLTVVGGSYNQYGGSVSSATFWTVYDGGGSPLGSLEFATRTSDVATAARIRNERSTSLVGGVILTAAGIGLIAAGFSALQEADDIGGPLALTTVGTVASCGFLWPIFVYRKPPKSYYSAPAADAQIERYNTTLRQRLGLTEQDTLSIDTR